MNKKIKLCSVILSFACLMQGAAVWAEDISDWTVLNTDETAQIEIVRDTVKSGYAALCVSTEQTAEDKGNTRISQRVYGLEPSTDYRFTFCKKAEHIEKYSVVRDIFNTVDSKKEDEGGTFDWTEKTVDFTTSKRASYADILFEISYGDGNKAKMWIDDVSLYKLSDGVPVGENLILNGGFEEGVDVVPPEEVSDVSVTSEDGQLTVVWKDSPSSDFKGINIFVDGDFREFVNAGEEVFTIDNLENGQEYKITLKAEDTSGNQSEGVVVYGSPKSEAAAPDVYADDVNDVIEGITEEMEYSVDGGDWTAYSDNSKPQLEGSHLVKVRYKETELISSGKYKVLIFSKEEKQPEENISFSVLIKLDEVSVKGNALANSRVRIAARLEDAPNTIVFIKETDADADGSFEQKFYMPYTAPAGHYLLQCKADNNVETNPAEFIYTNKASLDDLIARLKDSSETEILNIFLSEEEQDKLISLVIKTDGFSKLDAVNKANVASVIYNNKKDISETNLDGIVNSEIALGLIRQCKNSGEVMEVLYTYQPWIALSMENVGFDRLTDNELISWICEKTYGKSFKDSKALMSHYQKMCAFYILNGESYVNLGTVMSKYKSELEIENSSVYKSYANLSDTAAEAVNRKVKLANQYYDNTDKLLEAIKNAMPGKDTGGGSSGGSGGGGGSSSGSGVPVVNTSPTEKNDNPDEDKKKFNDLDSVPWAEQAINSLAQKGILSGIEEGVFAPNSSVTREQLTVMVVNVFKIEAAAGNDAFTDVEKDRWSYKYIMALKSNGLISGYEDGTFLPQKQISREDMVSIFYRALTQKNITIEKIREEALFTDWDDVSGYAKDGVREMYCMGLVNGDENGAFAPKGTATRAMAAKILYDIVEGMEQSERRQ